MQKASIKIRLRKPLKAVFDRYLHVLGREVLVADAILSRYPQLGQPCAAAVEARVPTTLSFDGQIIPELADGVRHYGATFVYRFPQNVFQRLEVLANGGILIDGKIIPHTGVGRPRASVFASIWPTRRKSRQEEIIVAPWPHYMDLTYGDFMLHILPRICRIVNRLTAEEKRRAVIAYPLAKTTWETEYLGKLGFQPEQLVDTRVCRPECSTQGAIYAASGEDTGWVIRGAHPADYEAARQALWKSPTPDRLPSRRLYLQRKGRRRILNEKELLGVLKPYAFEPIDLSEHSITEQMAMIADASIIFGAQGANINNMLWCSPGAMVVELFNRGFRPSYNRQMAFSLALDYRCWAEKPMEPHHFSHLNWDVTVDLGALEKFLAENLR